MGAGTFIFDITGLKSTSTLTSIPNNPFVTFPSPGSKCDVETLGYSKFKFTFACSPNLTSLTVCLIVGPSLVCLICCATCYILRLRRLRQNRVLAQHGQQLV